MGKLLSKIFGNKEMRILMLGLDSAGKTSEFLFSGAIRVRFPVFAERSYHNFDWQSAKLDLLSFSIQPSCII